MKKYKEEVSTIAMSKEKQERIKHTLYRINQQTQSANTQSQRKPLVFAVFLFGMIVCTGVYFFLSKQSEEAKISHQSAQKELKRLDITNDFQGQSMGYEGFSIKDRNDIQANSVWDFHNGIKELPVFVNTHPVNSAGEPLENKRDEKIAKGYALLEKMQLQGVVSEEQSDPYSAYFHCEEGLFRVYDQTFDIIFSSYLGKQTMEIQPTNKQEVEQIVKQKMIAYPNFFPIASGVISTYLHYGIQTSEDDSVAELPTWEITISEQARDQVQALLNQQFHSIRLSIHESNGIDYISYQDYDLSASLGMYPIISYEKAIEKLQANAYYSNGPKGDTEDIVYAELVYNKGLTNSYFIPYYRFVLPVLDSEVYNFKELGHEHLVVCYVPAIEDAYLISPSSQQ